MTVEVFSPDAHVETDTVDGFVREGTDAIWATIRGDGGESANDDATSSLVHISASASTDVWSRIDRGVLLFNVTNIPAGSIIQSVLLAAQIVSGGLTETLAGQSIVLVSMSPANDNALELADYAVANFGTGTPFSDALALSGMVSLGTFIHTLNSDGVAHVQTAVDGDNIVRLGHMMESDRGDVEPTWGSLDSATVQYHTADEVTNDIPRLFVTYGGAVLDSLGGSGGGVMLLPLS